MANIYFAFKKFTIYQDKCAMKVGTDGVLLGAWADVKEAGRILDVGTGTGLIAIMMAQRSSAIIDAVEIDEKACSQALENAIACPWYDRINIYLDSFHHFAETIAFRYDIVVSNPPYFQNSLKPPSKSRSIARHNDNLGYEELLFNASKLLKPDGRFMIIIPANETDRIIDQAFFNHLFPSHLLKVKPLVNKDFSRCLIAFTQNRDQVCIHQELLIKHNSTANYSDDYIALTSEYYLNM